MVAIERPPLRTGAVFHFGKRNEGADPIDSLKHCLQEVSLPGELDESLVILPEAFNVRGDYWVPAQRRYDAGILRSLKRLSAEFGVALVAGLIEGRRPEHSYSAAYLIDGDFLRILSRKIIDDGSGLYKPALAGSDVVLSHRGINVAALICVDGLAFNSGCPNVRQSNIIQRMRACEQGTAVLCLPAHSLEYYTTGVATSWPVDVTVMISNSSPRQPSVIRVSGDPAVFVECKGAENKVVTAVLKKT